MKTKLLYVAIALIVAVALVAVAVPAVPVGADTPVSGHITVDTTWDTAGSPYIVTADVTVDSGKTLTIDPGVTVKFNSGTSLYVDGTLVAEGTSGSNIVFTSNAGTPAGGDWWRIQFNTGSTGSVKYCDIAYGTIPIYLNSVSGSEGNPAVTVENCNLHDNKTGSTTISLITSDYNTIKDNTVSDYDAEGIWLDGCSHNNIEGNELTPASGHYGDSIALSGNHGACSYNTIKDNTINGGWVGIFLCGGFTTGDDDIHNNLIEDNTVGTASAKIEGNALSLMTDGALVRDNIFRNNSFYTDGNYGLIAIWSFGTYDFADNIELTGNTFTAPSGGRGLYIGGGVDATEVTANFNNIVIDAPNYAAKNQGTGTLNAEHNWWGTTTGSEILAMLVGTVDYDPWLGASIAEADSATITGSGTMQDTPTGGDVTLDATGDHTVTTATYTSNPGGTPTFTATGDYWDVHLDDDTGVNSLTIQFCPATAGKTIYYWAGSSWQACSQQSYSGGCIVVTITASTDPSLSELTGIPFGEGQEAAEPGCFIATAAYGTSTAEQLDVLRAFRDQVLLESTIGSQFVALYYQMSPPVAEFISGNSFLKTVVRELLVDPMVSLAKLTQSIWGD